MVKGKRRVKRKIRFKQSASLKHKNDATRVDRPDAAMMRKVPLKTIIPDNGATFKIKLRKRN